MDTKEPYDVCLFLEGTYPYVAGGVSEWTHHLIQALPDISFTGVCILPSQKESETLRYELPDNLHNLTLLHLHEPDKGHDSTGGKKQRKELMELIRSFHHGCREGDYSHLDKVLNIFQGHEHKGLTPQDLIFGRDVWDFLVEQYKPEENLESFIDYFWTFRTTHMPIFKLLDSHIPSAQVYHAVSTGYAGLLGAMATLIKGKPFMLTEHGLYSREREIDIIQTEWIYQSGKEQRKIKRDPGAFQQIWINLFQRLGKIAYSKAERILTICDVNREQQLLQGADPLKTSVIPNGINIEKFGAIFTQKYQHVQDKKEPPTIGFIGRVVPIKDVKTLLRASRIVSLQFPDVRILIMGPTEEDPAYYHECAELTHTLDMADSVTFTGKVNVLDYFAELDLVVLTSISEAQPLIILECNCAGIPVVASDVGACREMLEGRTMEDKELGPSGIVTGVADPSATAQGILTILKDEPLRRKMAHAGHQRVKTFYQQDELHRAYRKIYQELFNR